MNSFQNALILSGIAGLSSLIGFLFIFININNTKKFLSFIISFSLIIMLCISLFDLIPEALNYLSVSSALTGITIFFIIFYLTNLIFKKIDNEIEGDSLYNLGLLSCICLFIHNIPEGILTFNASLVDFHLGLKICLAIALHNIPEGIAVAVPVYYAGKGKGRAFFLSLTSSVSEPIAGVISFIIPKNYINNALVSIMMIFAASLMIFLSVFRLYPEVLTYKEKKSMYYGFVIGFILFIISNFILG